MLKISLCVVLSIFVFIAGGDTRFPDIFRRQAPKEEFELLITEQGSQYKEKVIFDMIKKTVVHNVPAHRNISKSNVMVDFVSNLTVTRLVNKRLCYVRPKSPLEPHLNNLKQSMDMVSNGTFKMKAGFRVIRTQWRVKGLTDMSRLSNEIIDFCRGMHIYDVEELIKDNAKVVKANTRSKRTTLVDDGALYVLCKKWKYVKQDLKRCPKSQWKLKCKFTVQNCFHYVYCTGGVFDLRDGICTSVHKFDDFTCCTPSCP